MYDNLYPPQRRPPCSGRRVAEAATTGAAAAASGAAATAGATPTTAGPVAGRTGPSSQHDAGRVNIRAATAETGSEAGPSTAAATAAAGGLSRDARRELLAEPAGSGSGGRGDHRGTTRGSHAAMMLSRGEREGVPHQGLDPGSVVVQVREAVRLRVRW